MTEYECKMCGTTERVVPHHIHGTSVLAAELCRDHNLGLRYFEDDPRVMVRYGFKALLGYVPVEVEEYLTLGDILEPDLESSVSV